MVYLAMMLGKASKYEVVSKGCIPVGLMLKGIYGSTSVTGVLSFLQKKGEMAQELKRIRNSLTLNDL